MYEEFHEYRKYCLKSVLFHLLLQSSMVYGLYLLVFHAKYQTILWGECYLRELWPLDRMEFVLFFFLVIVLELFIGMFQHE